jgi:spermidine/putrescine transport system ATP-binding protein
MAGEVLLVDLAKVFGEVTAVDGINLEVHGGEFFSLLGPSGCGKTTTLRLIAGFERPTGGAIFLDGEDMAQTPPHRRPVNTVFQSYALFPHLDVFENVAFGLRYKGFDQGEAAARVGVVLDAVRMSGMAKRKPTPLSGGQQQRVALARALVLNPSVLLLDEPLGALDAKLRKALQAELKTLQEEVGITFLYVTHDQEEALTMSDRLAVMEGGRVVQVGTPAALYEDPANAYVAEFLGVSNLLSGVVVSRRPGACTVGLGEVSLVAGQGDLAADGNVVVCIRPERLELCDREASGENLFSGSVVRVVYVGPSLQVLVHLAGAGEVWASLPNLGRSFPYSQGSPVMVRIPAEAVRVLA